MLKILFATVTLVVCFNSEMRAQDLSRVMVDLSASNTDIVVNKELLN